MFFDVPVRDYNSALDTVAEELLWEAGVHEPPVDAFLIAMRLGVVVTEDVALPGRAQLVRLDDRLAALTRAGGEVELATASPTIVLGQELRFERRQFAVAHELGEFAAVRVCEHLAINPRQMPLGSREQVANALAGRLLLPQRWLQKSGEMCQWDLAVLKEMHWTASHELIARRLLDCAPPVVITLFDEGRVTWRRSNLGRSAAAMLTAEHDCWQQCHHWATATDEQVDLADGARAVVRCWPVHEPHWRREVMRTELVSYE